jgi:hypothetical protein
MYSLHRSRLVEQQQLSESFQLLYQKMKKKKLEPWCCCDRAGEANVRLGVAAKEEASEGHKPSQGRG